MRAKPAAITSIRSPGPYLRSPLLRSRLGSTRCGISAKQIQRETGVTYKTAWRMFRQIRSLLSEEGMQLEGSTVEMDEMYHGGKRQRQGQRGRPSFGSHAIRLPWWAWSNGTQRSALVALWLA